MCNFGYMQTSEQGARAQQRQTIISARRIVIERSAGRPVDPDVGGPIGRPIRRFLLGELSWRAVARETGLSYSSIMQLARVVMRAHTEEG